MEQTFVLLLAALQITLLDIVLSGDNVGVIALAIRNLNPKEAKVASIIGVSGAIGLRIIFASIITLIMTLEWLPIKLVGGILLLKITWDLISQGAEDDGECNVKSSGSLFKAVMSIIIADISMSLDNVLAIAGSADGNIALIAIGIVINIPIIFFGSQYVAALMKKYKITIFIGGAILMHTALDMIVEDKLIVPYLNHIFAVIFPWAIAALTLAYGVYKIKRMKVPVMVKTEIEPE
jgi:YjbE family integral membrane protein